MPLSSWFRQRIMAPVHHQSRRFFTPARYSREPTSDPLTDGVNIHPATPPVSACAGVAESPRSTEAPLSLRCCSPGTGPNRTNPTGLRMFAADACRAPAVAPYADGHLDGPSRGRRSGVTANSSSTRRRGRFERRGYRTDIRRRLFDRWRRKTEVCASAFICRWMKYGGFIGTSG